MTARNWTIKTVSALAAIVLTLIITVNFVIDPYGEFRFFEGNYNKLKLKAEKTTALNVASKLENAKYALVFGSSRTMLIDKDILGKPVLNFSTSIYNNPGDILALLKMFNEQQLKNISEIYYLIDINSFHYSAAAPEMADKGSLLLETVRNVGPEKIEDAWKCLKANLEGYSETDYPNNVDKFGSLHKMDRGFKEEIPFFDSHFLTPYYLNSLSEIASFCKKNTLKIKFFTLPWQRAFPGNQQKKIEAYIPRILPACQEYCNFQLNTPLTGNKEYFADPSHLNKRGLRTFFSQNWGRPLFTDKKFSTDRINFATMPVNKFIQYVQKSSDAVALTQLSDHLIDAGRQDLILALLNTSTATTTPKTLIANAFLFGNQKLTKVAITHTPNLIKRSDIIDLALYQAIASGKTENVKNAILLGANVNSVDTYGRTPLICAALYSPSTDIISSLIETGADPMYINKRQDHLAYCNRSIFTIAFDSDENKILSYLAKKFNGTPLMRHVELLENLKKNPNNTEAYMECKTLQNQYYKSGNMMTARIFYLGPKNEYLKKEGDTTILKLGQTRYKLEPTTKTILENISLKLRIDDIIRQTFMITEKKRVSAAPEDQQKIRRITATLNRIIPILLKNKAVLILK